MKNTRTCVLLGLLSLSGLAQATCNANIPLTRSNSRYEEVKGATPAGSEVADTTTGLVWQRCLMGMLWDNTNRTCTGAPLTYKWQDALEEARKIKRSTALVADSWRVPNHAELFSLVDRACVSPAINTNWFPAPPVDPSYSSDVQWSSSPLASSIHYVWTVMFATGEDGSGYKDSEQNRLRLVRSVVRIMPAQVLP